MSKAPTYLTPQQVYQLNEKHGWFQHGDAQSDVSKAFAQDAIEMHERMRAAAPDMLAALRAVIVDDENGQGLTVAVFKQVIDAISKAMNAPVKEPA